MKPGRRLLKSAAANPTSSRSISKSQSWSATLFSSAGLTLFLLDGTLAQSSYTPVARWGQASALFSKYLVLQGGKTQGQAVGGGGYTYTSAPSSSDLLLLDLSSPFPLSSVPWELVPVSPDSPSPAPVVAFHTLSPLAIPNNTTSTSDGLFVFGGDASAQVPIQTNNDSSYSLTINGDSGSRTASWTLANSTNWLQSQPERRIYHSAESDCKGGFWVVGGEKADGSNIFLNQLWHLNATDSSSSSGPGTFQNLESPPGGIVGGTSTLLSDGTLLMLGGLTSQGTLQPMDQVYSYSTTKAQWGTTSATGSNSTSTSSSTSTIASAATPSISSSSSTSSSSVPSPRRGHIAVSLPDQRVFIHGGANADLSVAYEDAWILDWSVNPPRWSQVGGSDSTSTSPTTTDAVVLGGVPSARFGHSAVAYGRNVLISLGWNGGNPADSNLYVWDGTGLASSGTGGWSGGSWVSSTYSPDPQVNSNPGGSGNGNSNSGSNGSSTSNGGSSSGNSGGTKPTSSSDPFVGTPTSSSDPKPKDSGKSAGATAGAVFGALIGVGLIAGAGYALYRRQQINKGYDHWRRGDGAGGLLGAASLEKENYGDGGIRSSSDPRGDSSRFPFQPFFTSPQSNRDIYTSPTGGIGAIPSSHTFGNVGHAMEGSGPHFRERLAMLAGIGLGGVAAKEQPRFDMLADEDEDALELGAGDSYAMRQNRRSKGVSYGGRGDFDSSAVDLHDDGVEDEDEDDEEGAYARRVRERSYGRVEQEDFDDDRYEFSDSNRNGRGSAYVTSPFEDPSDSRNQANRASIAAGAGLLAGAMALATTRRAERDERFEIDGVSLNTAEGEMGTESGPSSQSHGTSYESGTGSNSNTGSWSTSATTPGGLVSFSDASHGKGRSSRPGLTSPLGPRANPSPLIRRSPTWWDRFMGTNFITSGPNSEQPIRDPAAPPVSTMTAIKESPRPSEPSYVKVEDPFKDPAAADELGRRNENGLGGAHYDSAHVRSLSSLQSARTGTSSHLEAQFRNMDVVQRTRTGSSRRTGTDFSSDAETSSLPSRAASLRRSETDDVFTPGSIVWEGESWETLHNPHAINSGAKASSGVPTTVTEEEINPDGSLDISELKQNPFEESEKTTETKPLFSNRLNPNSKETKSSHVLEASETPSVTKRARSNPILTSPLVPQPVKEKSVPLSGSVRERVQALEKEKSAPTSPSSSRSPNKTLSALVTPSPSSSSKQNLQPSIQTCPSKPRSPSPNRKSEKIKYEHGLAPKAQLFVANPDRRGSSTSSS